MPGAGVLRRSRTAAIAAASAQPIAPKLMNRRDGDARAAPVSDERPARFCDDAWPAPFFDRDPRRVATIAISSLLSLVAVSLLLLCLLLGGTASYSAAVVFIPIFILLALVLCCGCCALCMGMAAAAGAWETASFVRWAAARSRLILLCRVGLLRRGCCVGQRLVLSRGHCFQGHATPHAERALRENLLAEHPRGARGMLGGRARPRGGPGRPRRPSARNLQRSSSVQRIIVGLGERDRRRAAPPVTARTSSLRPPYLAQPGAPA